MMHSDLICIGKKVHKNIFQTLFHKKSAKKCYLFDKTKSKIDIFEEEKIECCRGGDKKNLKKFDFRI